MLNCLPYSLQKLINYKAINKRQLLSLSSAPRAKYLSRVDTPTAPSSHPHWRIIPFLSLRPKCRAHTHSIRLCEKYAQLCRHNGSRRSRGTAHIYVRILPVLLCTHATALIGARMCSLKVPHAHTHFTARCGTTHSSHTHSRTQDWRARHNLFPRPARVGLAGA